MNQCVRAHCFLLTHESLRDQSIIYWAEEYLSDFLDAAQQRIDEWKERASNIDTEQLVEDSKATFNKLIDNALAGSWLNRGELWGAIQLVFVFLLFRNPGYLDGLVGFLVGPVAMLAGIAISVKAAFDLGRKNISIWPAPTPDGELVVEGLYSYVRHPIYSGVILSSLRWSSATGSLERFALTIALAFFLAKKIEVEEKFLREKYSFYDDYMEDVPNRLFPRIW